MAFNVNDIGKHFNKVKDSAQKSAEVLRVQKRISTMKQEAENIYYQLGKSYYAQFISGDDNNDLLNQLCAMLATLERDIQALDEQIDEIRNIVRCPKCGNTQDVDSSFCASCGQKLEPRAKPEPVVEEVETEPEPAQAEEEEPVESAGNVSINWPEAGQQDEGEDQEDEEPFVDDGE